MNKKIINFLKKIENLESRDKFSLFIWMIAFLILINFSDFSWFKADIISTWTWITNQTEEETSREEVMEEVVEEKDIEEISEEVSENISEEEKIEKENELEENILWENSENNLENEILEEEISQLKEETNVSEETQVEEITISENPVLTENSTNTWEILEENLSEEIVENNSEEDFLELKTIDKNTETLAILEAEEEEENKIEIISDISENNSYEEEILEEVSKNISEEKNILDEKIDAAIQEIQAIEAQDEIQKQAEILAQEIISNQTTNEWLSEDDFTVSWAETEAYNEMIRAKKEQEIIDKYEKQLEEQESENKDLADRLEMLENKLKNQEEEKTAEEIAAEQAELSQREIAKREAEEQLKILEAEKAEKLRLANIEKEKVNTSIKSFNKDSDWDWLSDHIEKIIETNQKLIDTDWDWYSDKTEIDKFFSPNSEWNLFSDISDKDQNKNTIISAVKKWLVFLRTWDKFLPNEEIYRNEAIKIIVSAMYPSEIYRENEFFEWIELYWDVSSSDDYARYLAIAIKHWILDWIIADSFDPYSTFSKSEFIKILINATWKWISNKKIKWVDTEYDNWFTPYFSKAKEIWIIDTETYNRIFPLKDISRIEAIEYALKWSKYWN